MAVLAECPICHKKQAVKNKQCACGQDLDQAKRSRNVRYWVTYRLADGKQRREICDHENPYSIAIAKAADGKRKAQKVENPSILERLPEENMTVKKLAGWYLQLKSVAAVHTFDRVKLCLDNFTGCFGDRTVSSIKSEDLEDYQIRRREAGRARATVDMEMKYARAMITKAFDNDLVSGKTLKAFRGVKRLLKGGGNARATLLSLEQYQALLNSAPGHYRSVLVIALNTGMRLGEIRQLRWEFIDKEAQMIRLPRKVVKERRDKRIPINHHVQKALDGLPKAIHHDFVITYQGTPLNRPNSLKKQFVQTCEKAGIPYGRKTPNGITFHDIRRTVKTNMVAAGVDKAYRDAIFGHSSNGMDAHYVVVTDDALRSAMNRYTQWLDRQFTGALKNVDQTVDQVNR